MKRLIIALALGAALLTGCGTETQSVTERVTDDAWKRKTPEEIASICVGIQLRGPDRVAREIEDGARANGAVIVPGTDFKEMARIIKDRCEVLVK